MAAAPPRQHTLLPLQQGAALRVQQEKRVHQKALREGGIRVTIWSAGDTIEQRFLGANNSSVPPARNYCGGNHLMNEQHRTPGRYGIDEIETSQLEGWPNSHAERDYVVHLEIPEFTCLCPRSGFPDFATISIDYVPDQQIVELKSLQAQVSKQATFQPLPAARGSG